MPDEQSITEINWSSLLNQIFTPSPESWEDQVLYFVMIDRFSDGKERGYRDVDGNTVDSGTTLPLIESVKNSVLQSEITAAAWRVAGDTFCGGTIAGLQSKLGYLKRLGVTTIWLSPVLKQAIYDLTTYHGYGTQNFLAIDPHFGTKEQFKSFVDAAHGLGMYVVLDIIVNHAGNVFSYDAPDQSATLGPKFNDKGIYPVVGYHDNDGKPTLPFGAIDLGQFPQAWPEGAVWPQELQTAENFSRRGAIDQYEEPEQYLHGDFMKLKELALGQESEKGFQPSVALQTLTQVYQYWLVYADLDGYRLDAVKHMEPGAVRYFIDQIKTCAQQLGKKNFYIIGEVAGGRARAAEVMQTTRLSAVLAVDDVPGTLEALAKGHANPQDYFSYFSNSTSVDETSISQSTRWQGAEVITMYDDHDQIRNGYTKARFAAGDDRWQKLEFNALATLVTTVGIPGIYYGSEQAFDGAGGDDNYIREAMFGGSFGPFRSTGHHCFDEESGIYKNLSRLLAVRQQCTALRRGSQHLLETSGNGVHFGLPHMIGGELLGVVAWLRKWENEFILCAMNTDANNVQTVTLALPPEIQTKEWRCLFSTDEHPVGSLLTSAHITVPRAGFVVYQLL